MVVGVAWMWVILSINYGCLVLCVVVYGGWVGVFMCGLWGGMIRGFFNWGQVV